MKKTLLTLTLTLVSLIGFSQTYLWHSVDDCVTMNAVPSGNAVYEVSAANPDAVNPVANPNSSTNVSSITSDLGNNNITFDLPAGITAGVDFSISFRFWTANAGSNNDGSGRMIVRMYNSSLGTGAGSRLNLPVANKVGGEWEDYTYSEASLPDNTDGTIAGAGGYDKLLIIPSNNAVAIETLYFDDIELNIENSSTPLPSEATLVTNNQWYYNNSPNAFNTAVEGWGGGTDVVASQATPTTNGNSSPTVLKFTRNDLDATTGIKFDQASNGFKYDEGDGKITVRIYAECNLAYGTPNLKIRARYNGAAGTQIQTNGTTDLIANQWNEVTLDLTDAGNQSGLTSDGLYNEVYLIFNQGTNIDTNGNPAVFYIDALQVPGPGILSVNEFELDKFSVYPNPVSNAFKIEANSSIESVELYNITGRLIKTFTTETSYDISDLATGVYIANIKIQSGSKALRIVKE